MAIEWTGLTPVGSISGGTPRLPKDPPPRVLAAPDDAREALADLVAAAERVAAFYRDGDPLPGTEAGAWLRESFVGVQLLVTLGKEGTTFGRRD